MYRPSLDNLLVSNWYQSRKGNLRRRVVVLKEVEVGRAGVLHLVSDGLASRALEGRDEVRVAGGHGEVTEVLLDVRAVVVVGRTLGGGVKLSEVDLAIAAERVRRSLEILQVREEENEAAGLAGVRVGNVEVEDRRHSVGDGSVERGARRLVRGRRVNGDDQVGILIVAREVRRAAGATRSRTRWLST